MTPSQMTGFGRGGLDAAMDFERPGRTAAELNAASLEAQQRRQQPATASGPMLAAARMLECQRALATAVEAQAAAQQRVREATSTLHAMGGAAEVQAAYERALALGQDVLPPVSRETQAAKVRGLTTLAEEAQARVANLSMQVQGHRRAVVAALMPGALAAYKHAAEELARCYADVLTLQQQGAVVVLLNGNQLRIPSAAGLPEPGGGGVLVSTSSVVDSGGLGAATDRIEAEVQRLLSMLKQQEALQ